LKTRGPEAGIFAYGITEKVIPHGRPSGK
jgi:hypothetical protein